MELANFIVNELLNDTKFDIVDKLLSEEGLNGIKEENPDYRPDAIDYDNILSHEFSDPSTGRKFTIRQGLHLDPTDFAHQEARRIFKVLAAKNHIQAPGNIGTGQQSPKSDKKNQLNLSLGVAYGEGIDLDETSARGSGYDEKTLDKLIKNPDTGEMIKVRSALNYPKDNGAYKAAMSLVRKVNAKSPHKKAGGQKHPVDIKKDPASRAHTQGNPPQKQQPPNASEPISIAKRFGAATQDGSNTQNGTHSTNKTQKPLEKPLSSPNDIDRPVEPKEPTKGIQPTKSTTDANNDGNGKVNTTANQNPKITSRNIKHNIGKWSPAEQRLFKTGQHRADSPLRTHIGQTINQTMDKIIPSVKDEMQHFGHTYEFAGEGLASLFDGKPVNEKQKDSIKKLAQILSVNAIKSIDNKNTNSKALMQHLGKHLAANMADVMVTDGIGKVIQNSGNELDGNNDKFIEWFGLLFAQQMKDGKIPLDVWDSAIQDYNRDKEDGKLDGDTNSVQNEIISEYSDSSDIGLGMSFGDYDANMGNYVGGNMTVSDISANANSANSTTGTEHNGTWDQFDNQNYYTDKLPGWQVIGHLSNTLPDEVKQRVLPIFNHGGEENGPAAHTIQKIVAPNLIKYESFERTDKDLIMEGGAAGHLAHPFEDEDLTFGDMKEMIKRGLIGGLDKEAPVTEKLDGQNIAFSVRDGKVVFGRNKGHVRDSGKNALDTKGIYNQFKGRGGIEKAFVGASEDLQAAVKKLSPTQIKKMFGNGSKFMSLEIILPETQNVIPYGKTVLVMHGTIEYNKEGEAIGRSTEDADEFARAVQKVGADRQKTFGIEGPKTIAFSDDNKKYADKLKQYNSELDKAAKEFKLNDKSKLEDYRRAWFANELDNQGIKFTAAEKKGLIDRFADGNKSFGSKSFTDDTKKEWFKNYESTKLVKAQKQMIKPIENVFLNAGADSLKRVTNFLSANSPRAANALRKETLDSIKGIKDSKDVDKIAKLQVELERLHNIGMDKVVPSEGVVFQYNGKPYKFTGAFAPINQINGTFKFDKPKKGDVKKDDSVAEIPKVNKKEVAIFTGRFQPFHAGHYSIYKALVDKFGKDNVYIASSNTQDPVKSPFPFKDKKEIMHTMFDIPTNKIVKVKNPYAPNEILEKLPKDTPYVTAVSQKDAERLEGSGKYFKNYDKVDANKRKGYEDEGYYIVAPEMQLKVNGKNISGTQLRATFGDPKLSLADKKKIFTQIYPKFDKDVFARIVVTTKNAEKAKGDNTKLKTTEPQKSKVNTDIKNNKKVQKVLQQKIKNPETGRMILVKTALGYEKGVKVRRSAMQLVKNAMSK
jgi:hypothetical protein